MEKYIMQKIYNAYYEDIKDSEELARLKEEHQSKLLNMLNEEENIIFNKFIDTCDERNNLFSYESFKQGFRASIMLMIEVFN